MLIASAPWSTAQTIEAATLESVKSDLTISRRQPSPAPTSPTPLLPAAHASEATWVPWPIASTPAGLRAASNVATAATLPASSGWATSAPVSMIATVAPAPWVMSHAARKPLRGAHHSMYTPGSVSFAPSSVKSAGSFGWKRSAPRRSGATLCTRGSARRRPASARSDSPGRGTTVTRRICGTLKPLVRAPAAAATARPAPARVPGCFAAGRSVTSSRPVSPGPAARAVAGTASARHRTRAARRIGRRYPRHRVADANECRPFARLSRLGAPAGAPARWELSRSEAERELRVLAHLVRRPRRREHHRGGDLVDVVELADELLDLLGHLWADRAAGRGERERHVDVAGVDVDPVDQPQLDEIEPQLGVDHVRERVLDVFRCDHGLECSRAFCIACAHRLVYGTPGGASVLRGRGHRNAGLSAGRDVPCSRCSDGCDRGPPRAHVRGQLADARPRDGRAAAAESRAPPAPPQRPAAGVARHRGRRHAPAARRRGRAQDGRPGLSTAPP